MSLTFEFRYFEKATKFLPIFHFLFDIILIRCAKLLWPSQNIWTLITHLSSRCGLVEGTNLDEHAVFELGFWNDIGNYFTIVFYLWNPCHPAKRRCRANSGSLASFNIYKKSFNKTFWSQKIRKLCRFFRGVAPKTIYWINKKNLFVWQAGWILKARFLAKNQL